MNAPWNNAPLFYVLAHIQFNAIPAMAKYYPEIADRLRHLGYPDAQEDKQSVLSFGVEIGGPPDMQKVAQREVLRWRLSNREKSACFLLLEDGLIYQATYYKGRDAFIAEARKGLEVVHEIVRLDFVDRIGLRYLDAVMPKAGETLDQYLVPEALGLGGKLDGSLQQAMVEAVVRLPYGILVSHAYTLTSQDGYPPMPAELLPLAININPRFKLSDDSISDGLITVLDNDCFIQERVEFSLPSITQKLNQLRDGVGFAFDVSITDFAREVWK